MTFVTSESKVKIMRIIIESYSNSEHMIFKRTHGVSGGILVKKHCIQSAKGTLIKKRKQLPPISTAGKRMKKNEDPV